MDSKITSFRRKILEENNKIQSCQDIGIAKLIAFEPDSSIPIVCQLTGISVISSAFFTPIYSIDILLQDRMIDFFFKVGPNEYQILFDYILLILFSSFDMAKITLSAMETQLKILKWSYKICR
ncbi:hypothetical protein BpHYR1_050226 [Brachionus plicatilis]|uniref:Uncharacterized protein n=1 Tax=Brachionus plicatilis TaxID=10195 RepID=A0A3M7RJI0_BRAPC|nr:hypothetical protein BpHYR1_050226 [Brachionus plicatilis]